MINPGKYNFILKKGVDYNLNSVWSIDGVTQDLTGASAKMQIRATKKSTDALLTLASGDGITLGTTDGTIAINIPKDDTLLLTGTSAVYDLLIVTEDGSSYCILEGDITLSSTVTQL